MWPWQGWQHERRLPLRDTGHFTYTVAPAGTQVQSKHTLLAGKITPSASASDPHACHAVPLTPAHTPTCLLFSRLTVTCPMG